MLIREPCIRILVSHCQCTYVALVFLNAAPLRHSVQLNLDLCCNSAGTKASNPCDPTINYFPTATDIGAPVQKIVRLANGSLTTAPCTGSMNCAFPDVWSSASQHDSDILTLLGSDYDVDQNGVYKVAMKAYGGDTVNPTLYFVPTSPLLTANADVSACVAAAASAATRELQAATSYRVTNPGTWSYTIKRGSETVASQKVGNAGKLEVAGWPAEVRRGIGMASCRYICHPHTGHVPNLALLCQSIGFEVNILLLCRESPVP